MKEKLRNERHRSRIRLFVLYAFAFAASFAAFAASDGAQVASSAFPGAKPVDVPQAWKPLIGEYGPEHPSLIVLEKAGRLVLREPDGTDVSLQSAPGGNFTLNKPPTAPILVHFGQESQGHAGSISFDDVTFQRRKLGPEEGEVFQIRPSRPIDELPQQALPASPPPENLQSPPPHPPHPPPLPAPRPTIPPDFPSAPPNLSPVPPVSPHAGAVLQPPAADALLRALLRLKPYGYGLLIHDAYRPWYVTKIFWDATPPEGKIFVANPQEGSKHNRGCAVDLTLYDLATGKTIEMPGMYDEMSPRSFPNFPGGTSLQRCHRDLLRRAMESEGFTVNEDEWWHFDFKDWKEDGILNVPFEKLGIGRAPTPVTH